MATDWRTHNSDCVMAGARFSVSAVLLSVLLATTWAAQEEPTQARIQARTLTQTTSVHPDVAVPRDVAAPPSDAVTTASGIAMKVLKFGSLFEHPNADDCVILSFTAWTRDGSLFSTSGLHGESIVQCLPAVIPGIYEALRSMVAGEKRRIWVPAQLTFSASTPEQKHRVQADLTFDLELYRILSAPPKPENLTAPPRTAFRTDSGVILDVLREGTGTKHPSMTSMVTLNYSGWTADGKLFESTIRSEHGAVFLLGTCLPGWREALQHMVPGEKARVWIPAALAYGEGRPGKRGPAGNLVYDIELLHFE